MAAAINSTGAGGNVIPLPSLEIETQLCEIKAIADSMLYAHEQVDDNQRKRIMDNDIALLFIICDKVEVALKAVERIVRRAGSMPQ